MMLGARTAAWAGGGWENPYVTEGLIAMFDGEWNDGPGSHANNFDNGIVNIVSGERFGIFEKASYGSVVVDGNKLVIENARVGGYVGDVDFSDGFTMELVASTKNQNADTKSRPCYCGIGGVEFHREYVSSGFYLVYVFGEGFSKNRYSLDTGIHSLSMSGNNAASASSIILTSDRENAKTSMGIGYAVTRSLSNLILFGSAGVAEGSMSATNFYTSRFYNRVLSGQEKDKNYAIDKARFGLT